MQPCHENNGAAIYVRRAGTVHNPLFLNVHTTVEYLTKNASIGRMQHFKMYCSLYTAKAKNANKII